MDPATEQLLRAAYSAFNDRDLGAVLAMMHSDVDWPNAWEGGRVVGRDAVAAYWSRQFEAISSRVEPEAFAENEDGSVSVEVHQVLHDASTGEPISDSTVTHRWWFEGGQVVRMDVSA